MNCGCDDGTTVAAHTNELWLGKGRSIKAPDYYTAWLCHRCHAWLDQGAGMDPTGLYEGTRAGKAEMWTRAFLRTVARWFNAGVVEVA